MGSESDSDRHVHRVHEPKKRSIDYYRTQELYLPPNLSITWCRGSIFLLETWEIKTYQQHDIPQEVNDDKTHTYLRMVKSVYPDTNLDFFNSQFNHYLIHALKLSIKFPENRYHLIRCDNEKLVDENPNNAPYRYNPETRRLGKKFTFFEDPEDEDQSRSFRKVVIPDGLEIPFSNRVLKFLARVAKIKQELEMGNI